MPVRPTAPRPAETASRRPPARTAREPAAAPRQGVAGLLSLTSLVRYLAAFAAVAGRNTAGVQAALEPALLPVGGQGLLAKRLWMEAATQEARPLPPEVLQVSNDADFIDRLEALAQVDAPEPVLARDTWDMTHLLYRLPPVPLRSNLTAEQRHFSRFHAPYAIGSALRGDDSLSTTSGLAAVQYVRRLASQAGAVGTALVADAAAGAPAGGGTYRFAALLRRDNVTETRLIDPAGHNLTLPFRQFLDIFGQGAIDLLWSRAANETLAGTYVPVPGLLAKDAGINVLTASATEMDGWLQARQAPALAFDREGALHLVVGGAPGEARTFAMASATDYAATDMAAFAARFRFVDAAGQGRGDVVTVTHDAGPLVAGARYTFAALRAGTLAPQVALLGADGEPLTVELPTLRLALGADGLERLAATVREDPQALMGWHQQMGRTVLFDANATASPVMQRRYGDCATQSVFQSLLHADPGAMARLITGLGGLRGPGGPGAAEGGEPQHYRVAYTNPHTGRPAPVTINDRILVGDDGQPLGDGMRQDAQGRDITGILRLQKAFVDGNARYGLNSPRSDYLGIEYGRGDLIMTMVTGRPAERHYLQDLSDARLTELLDGAGHGRLVTLTSFENNVPAARDDAGFVNGHDYSVQGLDDDGGGGAHVTLVNPWGQSVPSGLPDDNGRFRIPVSLLRPHFLALSSGELGSGGPADASLG